MGKLWRRAQYWIRRSRMDAELAEEMEFHTALAGKRAMGGSAAALEDARGVWIWPWLESLWRDLAYGARNLSRQPGFTLVALAALAGAIGINTSLFTVFNALALRPWPVRDPSRVVTLGDDFSVAEARYLAEHSRSFSGVAAMGRFDARLQGRRLAAIPVTGNYFTMLDVEMQMGRGFRADEDRADAPQAVAVMSHALWRNRFGEDAAIIGKRISLDDIAFLVVGVAPREFLGTPNGDLWIPLPAVLLLRPNVPDLQRMLTSPNYCCSEVAARLAPGVTREQARAEAELLLNQFRPQFGLKKIQLQLHNTRWLSTVSSHDKTAEGLAIVGLVFFAVTLVLLLACANVGNLLLARAAARRQEIAVRLSLGGGRMRLVRQLLMESLVLALAASAIGLALAAVLPAALVRRVEPSSAGSVRPDVSVLLYTLALAVVACIAFGLAPALHATRGNLADALRQETRIPVLRLSLRGVLLSVQVAVSVVLLAAAGLLVRAVQRTERMDPGFATDGISVVALDLPASEYAGPRTASFAKQLQAHLDGPGVGLCDLPPLSNSHRITSFRLPGEDEQRGRMIDFHEVSAGYFDVLGIRMLAGRNFVNGDAARQAVIVNEAMARRYFAGENPVGKSILSPAPREIVGVVKNASTQGLGPPEPVLYFPFRGQAVPQILVRGGVPATESVKAAAMQLEPRVEVRVAPLVENFDRAKEPAEIGAAVAGGIGILALLLASVGMSGVFAYVVRQRTREIGIRMALGARPGDAVRLVLGSNLRGLLIGLLIGIVGAVGASKILAHEFYSVTALDPVAYGGVVLLLAGAALAASAAPARKAARVDPLTALRWE